MPPFLFLFIIKYNELYMEFIDHTGHVFSLPSYSDEPIGYEYNETKYIFWFNNEYGYDLSVSNYYFKPIRVLVPIADGTEESDIKINVKAQPNSTFKLISPKTIQSLVEAQTSMSDAIRIHESEFVEEITEQDIDIIMGIQEPISKVFRTPYYTYESNGVTMVYDDDGVVTDNGDGTFTGYIAFGPFTEEVELEQKWKEHRYTGDSDKARYNGKLYDVIISYQQYALIPFYIVAYSDEESLLESNILISTSTNGGEMYDYCPITVGINLIGECEPLIINGKNVGISLPKDIMKAVYECGFYNDNPDEDLYKRKLKEYLINFMEIKGQQGNFRSALSSLKWFGWGDKVTINKLWKTDIAISNHYVRDYFDITNDIMYSYQWFRNSTLIALSVKGNEETGTEDHNFNNEFYGEAKPIFGDLFDKLIVEHYDEGDLDFYRGYYDFVFNELSLKLCALKYFYEKYFLPMHMRVNTASVEYQCHANDIKWIVKPSVYETANVCFTGANNSGENVVEFPGTHVLMFNHQIHYVDSNYNEFTNTKNLGDADIEDVWYINDTCASIPIKFNGEYFNCVLILKKDGQIIHNAKFAFTQDDDEIYKNFVIHPKTINTIITGVQNDKFDINYWVDAKYELDLYVNGIWYTYNFTLTMPEFNIQLGHLEYEYWDFEGSNNRFRQIASIDETINWAVYMHNPELVTINNMDYIEEVTHYLTKNNLVYYDGNIEIGANYYYIEYDGTRYVFSSRSDNYLEGDDENNFRIGDGDLHITLNENGTYTLYNGEDVVAENLQEKCSIYETIDSYIKNFYTTKNAYVDNKYLNRCHLVDILDENGNKLEYTEQHKGTNQMSVIVDNTEYWFGDNSSEDVIALYRKFFDNDGNSIFDKSITYDVGRIMIPAKINDVYYDFYLMHDFTYWYGMFISRETVDTMNFTQLSFDINKKFNTMYIDDATTLGNEEMGHTYKLDINGEIFYLDYVASDSKILINRLKYVDAGGENHFDATDIIAMTLTNNKRLCTKLSLGTKWHIIPMSIGMTAESEVESPNEMAVVSIGNGNVKYSRGYYTVECRYSLDDFIQHEHVKRAKFRIN